MLQAANRLSPRKRWRNRRPLRWRVSGRSFAYNLRFPGQYFQAETSLNYNYARDYDSSTGRYVESDPIGLKGGSYSTYAYVKDDPIAYSDRFGLASHPGIGGGDINETLQDLPDAICDYWPAHCINKMRVCTEARCKYSDSCGHTWYIIINSWFPTAPTPDEVAKETPNCVCTKWKFRSGGE